MEQWDSSVYWKNSNLFEVGIATTQGNQ